MRPDLHAIDWGIIALYGVFALALGSFFTKKASTGVESFFVGDRKLPWWLAGTSIVATTFAADTPLAVTGLVAAGGISGNWIWWCIAIAHVVSTFFFARLWRRSGVITDAEITEVRYSGRTAAALRGFKAVYFGIFINCLTMAWVIAAMVKISNAFFDVNPVWVILICVGFSVAYTTLGGFRSVVFTDLAQFVLGMGGALVLAWLVLSRFGGLGELGGSEGLLPKLEAASVASDRAIRDVLEFVPGPDHATMPLALFVALIFAGWWKYAEGNGYMVQRLAACRDEGEAQGAALWFSVAHNALRPWPWILVGLGALVLYPQLGPAPDALTSTDASITVRPARLDILNGGEVTVTGVAPGATMRIGEQLVSLTPNEDGTATATIESFEVTGMMAVQIASAGQVTTIEGMRVELVDREQGYPLLMGKFLPTGLLGLVIASLLAAFMSTIDTHTNWGASYLVRDLYQRFFVPDAPERHYVTISRMCIVLMAVLAGISSMIITNIADVWLFLNTLGAGLGSVAAARWYWSRVTAHAEFAALGVTTVVAVGLQLFFTPTLFGGANPLFSGISVDRWMQIIIVAFGSLAVWVPVALFGPQNDTAILKSFADKVHPPGPGWRAYTDRAHESLWPTALRTLAGLVIVYGTLFGIGDVILGSAVRGVVLLMISGGLLFWVIRSGRTGEAVAA